MLDHDLEEALLAQVERLLDIEARPDRLKALLEKPAGFNHELWRRAGELGWPAVAVAEDHGGLGLPFGALAVILQALGARTASLPLIAGAIAANLLVTTEGAGELVGRLVGAGAIACLGFAEVGDCGLATSCKVSEGRLTGAKAAAPFAAVADVALVSAGEGEALGLYLVNLKGEGVERADTTSIDNARAAATLAFDHAPVTRVGQGWGAVLQAVCLAATLTAFEQVGGAQRCLDLAVAYAKERRVFGQPIGGFQAVKHRCADIYQEVEIGRGCAIDALDAFERGGAVPLARAAAARLGAGAAYDFAARECIQVHGGVGVTWEAEPQHHYRRARALALELGGAPYWRELLVDNAAELEAA